MDKVKKLLQKFYVGDADIDALLNESEDSRVSDEQFKKIMDGATDKYKKHFEKDIMPKMIESTRTETFSKSRLKFIKETNRKLNLGMTNSQMEEFENLDSFMDHLDSAIEDQKKGLRDSADSATVEELTRIKTNYANLQQEYDGFKKSHEEEIDKIKAKGEADVERTLARSKYTSSAAAKKIDMKIPGIKRTLKNIREELFENAYVDRDGNVLAKDQSPYMVNDRVVTTVDEYLDHVLKEEELLVVNNVDKTPRSYKDRRKDADRQGESEAVRKKRAELEASKSRRSLEDPNKRQSRF